MSFRQYSVIPSEARNPAPFVRTKGARAQRAGYARVAVLGVSFLASLGMTGC